MQRSFSWEKTRILGKDRADMSWCAQRPANGPGLSSPLIRRRSSPLQRAALWASASIQDFRRTVALEKFLPRVDVSQGDEL